MSEPYIGEIRMVGFSFPPAGWVMCNGQLMPISQNDALFTLIGTTYGGDGQETFAIPNLMSRVPMHAGNGFVQAEAAGTETVTLTGQQIPIHNHAFIASGTLGSQTNPQDNVIGQSAGGLSVYIADAAGTPMNGQSLSLIGGNQPHENMQPYLTITFVLSLFGVFPTQT